MRHNKDIRKCNVMYHCCRCRGRFCVSIYSNHCEMNNNTVSRGHVQARLVVADRIFMVKGTQEYLLYPRGRAESLAVHHCKRCVEIRFNTIPHLHSVLSRNTNYYYDRERQIRLSSSLKGLLLGLCQGQEDECDMVEVSC